MAQSTYKRIYSSLLVSVSCATSYGAPAPRIAVIHLPHHRHSFTLFINDQFCANIPDATPAGNTRTRLPLDPTSQHLRFRNPRVQGLLAEILFFLFPDYEYNQFLSQAGRPAEAQLGKSGRNNLAPGCWESCLELLSLRLFKNHKQLSPDQVVRQIFPLWNGALQISGYTWADLSSKSKNIRRVAVCPS
ncbi:hypothetical protein T4D_13414 [Trichinella pseudospiralis]|uniref:Uncharacterized protein n=1 Tax=Trichinella pseudospiralis TaxID=6337 RepID=A0A0V1F5B3_TRIPS|nr:hypothetical protein T4D_13414 [Trichinella pseudospiralis]